jgi:NTE family protein
MRRGRASPRDETTERNVLVLQGGGALGAYQAGVYEALAEARLIPDWISGVSIGAINAALIAGNPPKRRIERLRAFWDTVSSYLTAPPLLPGDQGRRLFNEASAGLTATFGAPGFFAPRLPPAYAYPPAMPGPLSFYDSLPLAKTLESLVDFDRLNDGEIRISVEAVNVRTGNFMVFDSVKQRIEPAHIMASGALPPGLPPIEIDGEPYWDGGVVSNTPLQYVLDESPRVDSLVFQVDLFSARGPVPKSLIEAAEREKDIRYSSRTRLNTDVFRRTQVMRRAIHRLLADLPAEFRSRPDVKLLAETSCNAAITIVHLIHRRGTAQSYSKDFDFSRAAIEGHWQAGKADVEETLRHEAWRSRGKPTQGVTVLDLTRPAAE